MFQFYNCTKSIIDDIFDWSANWTGSEALILEDCEFNSGNFINLWSADLVETVDPQIWEGTFNPSSVALCIGGFSSEGSDVNANVRRWIQGSLKTIGEAVLGEKSPFA